MSKVELCVSAEPNLGHQLRPSAERGRFKTDSRVTRWIQCWFQPQPAQVLQRTESWKSSRSPFGWSPARSRFWLGTKRLLWGKQTWPNLADLGEFRQPDQSCAASVEIHANRTRAQSQRHLHGPGDPSSPSIVILLLCSVQNILSCAVLKVPELSAPVGPLAAKETRLCSVLSEFLLRNARHILPFLGRA